MENIFVISESSWKLLKHLAYLILKSVFSYVKLIHHIFNELLKFMNIKKNWYVKNYELIHIFYA